MEEGEIRRNGNLRRGSISTECGDRNLTFKQMRPLKRGGVKKLCEKLMMSCSTTTVTVITRDSVNHCNIARTTYLAITVQIILSLKTTKAVSSRLYVMIPMSVCTTKL